LSPPALDLFNCLVLIFTTLPFSLMKWRLTQRRRYEKSVTAAIICAKHFHAVSLAG
jgi:hypothetical protein